MYKLGLVLLSLAAILPAAEVAKGITSKNIIGPVTFPSAALGQQRAFNILLPVDYETSTSRYPVLYLLHGYGDDQSAWSYMTNLSAFGAKHRVIVVMPDASKSWYVNAAQDPKARFEDYIVKDLVPYVDSHFRTLPLPRARAIAGLSMGGYGAMFLGLDNYKKFTAIGSFSGALDFSQNPVNRGKTPEERDATDREWRRIFGDKGSADRTARDPFALVDKVPLPDMPLLFITCGGEDFLIEGNRKFVALLASKRVPYEYREISPREHTWDFWDDSLRVFLDMLDRRVGFSAD
ncbi:MAG TPA: hypothetical protein DEQ47_02130 [Solibacterales bacterium]|nr:hypothetical protein [Bryobacterales bacterium]